MTDDLRLLAHSTATEAVRETFAVLGIDIENAADMRQFQANMAWVQRFRRLSEKVGSAVIVTVVTILTGGAVHVLISHLRSGGPLP